MSEKPLDEAMESSDGEEAVTTSVPSICLKTDDGTNTESGEQSSEQDPFAGSAEDVAADETRRKVELFKWADSVLGLSEADLELALDDAVKRFKEKAKEEAKGSRAPVA